MFMRHSLIYTHKNIHTKYNIKPISHQIVDLVPTILGIVGSIDMCSICPLFR